MKEERHSDLAKREAGLLKKAAELETERQELNRRKASNISDLGEMKKNLVCGRANSKYGKPASLICLHKRKTWNS